MSAVAAIFADLDASLTAAPATARALGAAYLFDLRGEGGGLFHVVARDGAHHAGPGAVGRPDATIAMEATDFVALWRGELDGTHAFMEGRLRVRGDLAAARRLAEVLSEKRA